MLFAKSQRARLTWIISKSNWDCPSMLGIPLGPLPCSHLAHLRRIAGSRLLNCCDVWACSRSCRDRKRWSIYYGERTTIYTGELSRDIELTLIHLQLQSYMWRNITDITWHITWQVFTSIQLRRKELATLPPHLVKQRSIAFGVAFAFCIGSALSIIDFYVSRVSFEIWLI